MPVGAGVGTIGIIGMVQAGVSTVTTIGVITIMVEDVEPPIIQITAIV